MGKRVKINTYAALCGITYNAVLNRAKTGRIAIEAIDGTKFVDMEKYPPLKKVRCGDGDKRDK